MSHRRSILAIAAALAVVAALAAPAAQAAPGPNLTAVANAIMSKDYTSFLNLKRGRPAPFDWSDDGCSIPRVPGMQRAIRGLENLFNGPCQLHDFGYRNYGRGLRLGRNENVRGWIDGRFLEEMQRVCRTQFSRWWQQANKATCFGQAGGIWTAVRHGGRDAFYNG